ncbi:hypothetical protein BDV93DRAFT_515972 [Ceratobasidium sp. AG-I]|nr:hypothetical protein BDV93DRAFT_515972 [Ceratobasidium sp. AG-I]
MGPFGSILLPRPLLAIPQVELAVSYKHRCKNGSGPIYAADLGDIATALLVVPAFASILKTQFPENRGSSGQSIEYIINTMIREALYARPSSSRPVTLNTRVSWPPVEIASLHGIPRRRFVQFECVIVPMSLGWSMPLTNGDGLLKSMNPLKRNLTNLYTLGNHAPAIPASLRVNYEIQYTLNSSTVGGKLDPRRGVNASAKATIKTLTRIELEQPLAILATWSAVSAFQPERSRLELEFVDSALGD